MSGTATKNQMRFLANHGIDALDFTYEQASAKISAIKGTEASAGAPYKKTIYQPKTEFEYNYTNKIVPSKEYHLTEEQIRSNALASALNFITSPEFKEIKLDLKGVIDKFEKYIRTGEYDGTSKG